MLPGIEDIKAAAERVGPYVHKTPVLTSSFLNEKTNAQVFLKCENFQRMGAFKMRGAVNAIQQLSKKERDRGVITHSSGNFALCSLGRLTSVLSAMAGDRSIHSGRCQLRNQ